MSSLDLTFLEESRDHRRESAAGRARAAIAVSMTVTLGWVVYVSVAGHWDRVADNWAAALTMVFGSFVAGATPQGGGAVAFPVFTKLLEVPTEVARTFSLSIQTVGMGCAALAIVINRRAVAWRAVAIGTPVAAVTFVATAFAVGDRSEPFWPSRLPGPYVKVTFTLIVAAMALVVFLGWRAPVRRVDHAVSGSANRSTVALVVAGALGGVAASLVGSGTDVFLYIFVVVLFGIDARIGVPSSVIPMALVSVVGLVLYGIIDGQLDVTLAADGATVTSVGSFDTTAAALPSNRFDLFGLWIAAVPVVAWGAPLGSWVASRLQQRHLVAFVIFLAVAETLSTIVFLDELRTSAALAIYGAVGLVVVCGTLVLLTRSRERLFGLERFDPSRTLRRSDLDVAPDFRDRLDGTTMTTGSDQDGENVRSENER